MRILRGMLSGLLAAAVTYGIAWGVLVLTRDHISPVLALAMAVAFTVAGVLIVVRSLKPQRLLTALSKAMNL